MSTRYPDARTWAQEHSLADAPRLARLEGFAFQAHPEVVASFGADGAAMARLVAEYDRRAARAAKNGLVGLVGVVVLLAPVVGVAVYASSRMGVLLGIEPVAAATAVPIAGVCFAISAFAQLVMGVAWLRGGALWSPGVLGVAAVTAILAVLAASGIPAVAARDGYDAGAWPAPVWAAVAVGGAVAVAVGLRAGARAPEPAAEAPAPALTVADRERARRLAQLLPEPERRAVQADRDEALRILAARGLIDDDTLRAALAADLGTLFTLDPIPGG